MDSYPDNWTDVATAVKAMAGGKCEHCGARHDPSRGYTLTVHHLNMMKADCRYENLVALCQRCHLRIQGQWTPGQPWLIGKPAWAKNRGY